MEGGENGPPGDLTVGAIRVRPRLRPVLAAAAVTDLRCRLIPNRLLALGVALGLPLLALADPGSLPGRFAAMSAAGGAFLAVSLLRPDGFGMGDVKLIATMGLFLGGAVIGAVIVALCAASLLGMGLVLRDGPGRSRRRSRSHR